jgi:hypothetical protein
VSPFVLRLGRTLRGASEREVVSDPSGTTVSSFVTKTPATTLLECESVYQPRRCGRAVAEP